MIFEIRKNSKSGFTLIELLVYMGIVGIIVVIAGEAFSNSTKFRIRTDNMIRATQEAENVGTLFREDAAQMGAKASVDVSATTDKGSDKFVDPTSPYISDIDRQLYRTIYDSVYMDPDTVLPHNRDSSSFLISTTNGFSDLRLRRVRYNDNGGYEAVEEVHWFVDNAASLKRSCRTILGTAGSGCVLEGRDEADAHAVTMATHVREFLVRAAKPDLWGSDSLIFPSHVWKPHDDSTAVAKYFRLIPRKANVSGVDDLRYHGGYSVNQTGEANGVDTEISLSNFKVNYNYDTSEPITDNDSVDQFIAVNAPVNAVGADPTTWQDFCRIWGGPKNKMLSLKKDATYEISFEIPYIKPFGTVGINFDVNPWVPGLDHMSIGFRDVESGTIPKVNGRYVVDDFMFYPPYNANGSGKRRMRFAVPVDVNSVCLALTFARYSPRRANEQAVKIKNLELKQVAGANYDFDEGYNPENTNSLLGPIKRDKKFVRALQMKLQVSRGAKNNQSGETGNVDIVVPIPSNGPSH